MIPTPYPLQDPLLPIGPVKVIGICACCENAPVWDGDTYCGPCAKNHGKKKVVPQPPLSDVTRKTARKLLKRRPGILKALGDKDE